METFTRADVGSAASRNAFQGVAVAQNVCLTLVQYYRGEKRFKKVDLKTLTQNNVLLVFLDMNSFILPSIPEGPGNSNYAEEHFFIYGEELSRRESEFFSSDVKMFRVRER